MTRKGTYYCRCVRDAVENLLYRPRCGGSVPLAPIALSRSRRKSCGGSLSLARARAVALLHTFSLAFSLVYVLSVSLLFLSVPVNSAASRNVLSSVVTLVTAQPPTSAFILLAPLNVPARVARLVVIHVFIPAPVNWAA